MNSSWYPARAASAFRCALVLGLAVTLTGCKRDKITEYRIPKEGRAPMTSSAAVAPASQPQIQGRIPAGWQQQQPDPMSMLSFAIPGSGGRNAQLSVMSIGSTANDLTIVNIVRQSAHLPPFTEAELSKLSQPVEVAGAKGSLIDFSAATDAGAAPSANRVMLTVLARDGATWLFKMSGDSSLVTEQKPALLEFLKSVTFTSGDTSPRQADVASTNPKPGPRGAPVSAGPAESASGKPLWDIPSNWKEVPPTQMLLAKFVASGQAGNADVTVSVAGGAVLANVNRWRGQLSLQPIAQEELEKSLGSLDVLGGKAMLVDVSGKFVETGKDGRIVAAIWPRPGETWFFKLTGDPAVAGREKEAFVRFVQSVRFPNG